MLDLLKKEQACKYEALTDCDETRGGDDSQTGLEDPDETEDGAENTHETKMMNDDDKMERESPSDELGWNARDMATLQRKLTKRENHVGRGGRVRVHG